MFSTADQRALDEDRFPLRRYQADWWVASGGSILPRRSKTARRGTASRPSRKPIESIMNSQPTAYIVERCGIRRTDGKMPPAESAVCKNADQRLTAQ